MAGTGTTRDRVWGSVTNERDEAFPHGQIWFYAHDITSWCAESVYTYTTEGAGVNSKAKARKWGNIQRTMAFISGPRGGRPKPSQPSLLNTLPDVLQHCLQVERTAVAVPSSISNSQLRPPSLIADAPLKLWLKLLDFETLEALHNNSVAASAKAKLLGQRDEAAYRIN